MDMQVYEVFRQEKEGSPLVHGGSVQAPDDELAVHYAREMYGRRGESVRLWVAPRSCVLELTDLDLLKPPLDRSHRTVEGYRLRDKLARARESS
jgi:ring-1,2-phenylacetyl-CoA epoxidase subunit PaaB